LQQKVVEFMDWQTRLDAEMAVHQKAIINIDGQYWKARKEADGKYTLVRHFGAAEAFPSLDQLKTAILSWHENPRIRIQPDVH
jgi:hypothetical protein